MLFVSKFSNRIPFSRVHSDIPSASVALYNRSMDRLIDRLISYENLLYNFESCEILDSRTRKAFSGKFFIPAKDTVRAVKVINGQEVSNGVFFRNRDRYSLEVIGHEPKKFNIRPSNAGKIDVIKKQTEADQLAYDTMVNNFVNEVEAGRINLYG